MDGAEVLIWDEPIPNFFCPICSCSTHYSASHTVKVTLLIYSQGCL